VVNRVDALGPRLPPTLLRDVVVDTDTGEITGVREGVSGLAGGVDFEIRRINAAMLPSVGVFSFGPLDIQGAVTVRGSRAVAFVVGGDARIAGVVDVRGSCLENAAGPGGYRGGYSVEWSTPAEGSGPGEEGEPRRGGGGGGHGGAGGAGSGPSFQTAPGGPIAGTAALLVLAGGSGGGAGALIAFPQGDPLYGGAGGGGGGAIQIVATGSLTVTGAEDGGPGGINAGGCGGKGGWGSGGGGGAGGAILLEAPVVRLEAGARLAANGGGGAAISSLGAAQSGQLDATRAAGSGVPPNVGGLGGASGEVGGGNGASTSSRGGSGGGGAAGRIRISTRTGLVERDASVIVSPGPEDAGPVTVFVPGTVE
jgi:hypothetical protein